MNFLIKKIEIENGNTTNNGNRNRCKLFNSKYLPPPPSKPLQKLVVVIAVILSVGFNAYSATLQVTNENDAGSGSLRQTIADAASGDVIVFAPDVNYITLTSGEIIINNKTLTINGGSGNSRVTLNGNNNSGIFIIFNPLIGGIQNAAMNINNLIFTKAKEGTNSDGSAVSLHNTTLTTTNCIFTENSSRGTGGAIYVSAIPAFTATLNAINCTFSKNSSRDGGAIYVYNANFTADGCTFTENSADSNGGAVYVIISSSFIATNCAFTENSAGHGGAVCNHSATSIAINCVFSKNFAQICGGAVDNIVNIFTALNCTFTENSTADTGGAIHVYTVATAYLYHCTFDGNQAPNGNAIFKNNSGTLYSYNCVYTGNHPQINGTISAGDNLIEGVNAIVTRNYVFGTNQFNGRYITPLPNARAAKKLDNTIQVPAGMTVDEILNKLAKDQRGNPRPIE